jgi:hypothetical protein
MTAWRLSRRHTVAVIGLVVVVAVAAMVLVLWSRRASTKLVAGGDDYGYCWTSPGEAQWARLQLEGMEFGMDVVNLSPAHGHVTVTKLELVKPTGGMRLVSSAFAPGATMAIGGFGSSFDLPAYIKPYARSLPATLESVSPAGAPADFKAGTRWQLGVVVKVPPGASDASAAGVKVMYRSGSGTHTYTMTNRIRITNGVSVKCPS